MNLPRARNSDIIELESGSELLIYNLRINKAYALNETSMIVFKACGDGLTFGELKNRHKFTDELIYLALDGLKKENLLEDDYISPFAGISRREVIRKVGLSSAIALPVISALIAPIAATAASACPPASSNIASGCPAGFVIVGQHSCDPIYNSERMSFCQPDGPKCLSRGATYGSNCTNTPGGGYTYNCVCR